MGSEGLPADRLAYTVKEPTACVGLEKSSASCAATGRNPQQESGQGPPGAPLGAGGMAGAERTRRRPRRLAFPGSINRTHHR